MVSILPFVHRSHIAGQAAQPVLPGLFEDTRFSNRFGGGLLRPLFGISKMSHTLWRLDLAVNREGWREGDDQVFRLFMVGIGQKWSKNPLSFLVGSDLLT
jgi:hypothetical protein